MFFSLPRSAAEERARERKRKEEEEAARALNGGMTEEEALALLLRNDDAQGVAGRAASKTGQMGGSHRHPHHVVNDDDGDDSFWDFDIASAPATSFPPAAASAAATGRAGPSLSAGSSVASRSGAARGRGKGRGGATSAPVDAGRSAGAVEDGVSALSERALLGRRGRGRGGGRGGSVLGRLGGEGAVVGAEGPGSSAIEEEEAAEVVLALLSVDYAIKQYILEVARDPAIGSDQGLWDTVGPLLLSSGGEEDESEVRNVIAQVSPLLPVLAACLPLVQERRARSGVCVCEFAFACM